MTQAWWSAHWPWMKRQIPLHETLLPLDPAPRRRQPWLEMKAALMLAIGPGKPKDQ